MPSSREPFSGGLFRPRTETLVVGSRNCTKLVDGVLKQVDLVRDALEDETAPLDAGSVVELGDFGFVVAISGERDAEHDDPDADLTESIQPEDGSPAWDATKAVTVSRVAVPRVGDRFASADDSSSSGTKS